MGEDKDTDLRISYDMTELRLIAVSDDVKDFVTVCKSLRKEKKVLNINRSLMVKWEVCV